MGNDLNKERPKDLMNHVSLKVLEDIKKEIAYNKQINKEEKEKFEKQERIKQLINSRSSISSVVIPAMLEVAADALIKDSFIKRIFSKLKK